VSVVDELHVPYHAVSFHPGQLSAQVPITKPHTMATHSTTRRINDDTQSHFFLDFPATRMAIATACF